MKNNLDNFGLDKIKASPGNLCLLRGDLFGAFQEFVQEGNADGLKKIAEEYYKIGRSEEAQKAIKKASEIILQECEGENRSSK